jgi:rod shape-determining protein MreC
MFALQRRTGYLLLALCLGHVLLISSQVQSRTGMPVLQSAAFTVFSGVQRALASIADGGRVLWTNYVALRGVVKENGALRQRILELEADLQKSQAQAAQTQTLEQALGLKQSVDATTLAARVIAGDPSPGSLTITVDRGASDGVQADMAVIGPAGIVGRVINQPLPHAAQVQLLIGRNAAAAVYFERTGAGGIAAGGGTGPGLHVDYVSNATDIKPGDRVLTSGQDGIYPRGFVVGSVTSAQRHGGMWTVAVQPATDFSHIDVVLIVIKDERPGPRQS